MYKMTKNILFLYVVFFLLSIQLSAAGKQFVEVNKGGKITRIDKRNN